MTLKLAGRTANQNRAAAVLLMVVISLALATAIAAGLLKTAVAERALLRTQEHQAQARWLAEAGFERAAFRLAADPLYAGETWRVAADELSGKPGIVRIQVENVPDRAGQYNVRAQADYPGDSDRRSRFTKKLVIERSWPPETEKQDDF